MHTDTATRPSGDRRAPRRARWLVAVAAVAVVAVGLAAAAALGAFDDGTSAASPPLELTLGAGDAMASCLPVEADALASMSPAFAGTVTSIQDERVTLDVDRWYTGGEAETVELRAEAGLAALIAGFDFAEGQRYLVTATDGSVNLCGYSGPATPELTALFDQAFAG